MTRVLSIASLPPFRPGDGLHTRTWHLLGEVAKHDDVTLLTWAAPAVDDDGWALVRGHLSDVEVLPWRDEHTGAATRVARQARFFAGAWPPYIQQALEQRGLSTPTGRARFAAHVASLHAARQFDVVVVEDEAVAVVDPALDRVPVVVHRLNAFWSLLGDLRAASPAGRVVWPVERRGWVRFDRAAMANASRAIAPTVALRDALAPLAPSLPWAVVANGITVADAPVEPGGADVVFIGWMGYPPNVDAVTWFAREIWPAVRAASPVSRFRIVGREPTSAVRQLAAVDGVDVVGEVPEIAPACRGAAVAVVPLRAGMGIKNKTLELMGLGLPVVATARGAEGIAAGPGNGLVVADDPGSIAAEVVALLRDPTRAAALGRAARRHVQVEHSWARCGEQYRACLAETVTHHRAGA